MSEELYWFLREHADQFTEGFTTKDVQAKIPHLALSHISSALNNLEKRTGIVEWRGKKGAMNVYNLVPSNFLPVPRFHCKYPEGRHRESKSGIKHPKRTAKKVSSVASVTDEIDALRDTLLEACIKLEELRKRVK